MLSLLACCGRSEECAEPASCAHLATENCIYNCTADGSSSTSTTGSLDEHPTSGAGGLLAARQEVKQYPTRTNQIPRHIPPPHWASHPAVLFLAAGLLPFGTIFVELYFAMTSIWQGYGMQSRSCIDACARDCKLRVLAT